MSVTPFVENDITIWDLASPNLYEASAEFDEYELTRIRRAMIEFWAVQEMIDNRLNSHPANR